MRKFYAFLFTASFLFSVTITSAQVSIYTFSQSNGVYTPITGGSIVGTSTTDDGGFGAFNIGFPFFYDAVSYTQFGIASNGFVTMGITVPSGTNYTPISSVTNNNLIAGFGRDIQLGFRCTGDRTTGSDVLTNVSSTVGVTIGAPITGTGIPVGTTVIAFTANTITISAVATSTGTATLLNLANGEMRFETIGVAPNRVCVIQWSRARKFGASNDSYDFQIRLNETTNVIDVVYGTVVNGTTTNTIQVGLRGPANTDFNNRTTTTNWATTTAGATNAATCSITSTVVPASGLSFKWIPPILCTGTPTPGTIAGPATACRPTPVTLTLSGYTADAGISLQWKSSTVSGGPYTNIGGATGASYTFNANTSGTTYYIATVTCTNGGAAANSAEHSVLVGAPVYSTLSSTVTSICTPGAATITATAINGAPGNYTHALTGPGTIIQNPPTGPNNSTANFTVTNLPFGNNSFVLTTTDALGCTATAPLTALINQTPVITLTPATATICNGQIQQITASVVPPGLQAFSQPSTIVVPAGSPAVSTGVANPYPSLINVAGLPATGVTVKSVKLGNVNHTFPDDMDVVLVSPTGQAVILMSDAGGGTDAVGLDYTFDDAAVAMADAAFNPSGTYKPTNFLTPDDFPAPGPGSLTQATPTLATFTGSPNGNWSLYVVDDLGGDFGFIGNWSITFAVPSLVTFSPATGLFTDALATIAYTTGTPTGVVFAKPTTTTSYIASANVDGCSSTATVNVTVNQLPAITTQPTPAAQTVCPGTTVTYSVAATGAGLTYQWRLGATNLVNNAQISGATTNTLTITNVAAANAGSYTVLVSGTCTPAVTSTAAVLTVASAPVISAQPASVTICAGANASFTVANAGSVPAPTIYQWQVSTDGGTTWTNLLTPDAFTPAITITGATIAQNATRYRVIVTNTCAQATTSSAAILTVNPLPTVTAGALPVRICISDSLVALTGSPVGGSWSGIGVSGFNFVPPATAVGSYTLTYRFTNTLGCASTATVVAVVQECPERSRLLANDALVVYPNPNSGRFFVRVNSTLYNYIGMKVYNAQGQLLNGKSVNDALVSPVFGGLVFGRVIPINLTHLPAGIYMVKFYYDGGVGTAEKGFKVVIGGH